MSNGESSNEESVLFLSMGRSTSRFFQATMKNHTPMPSHVYLVYESYIDDGSPTNNEWFQEERAKIIESRDTILRKSGSEEFNGVNIEVLRIPDAEPETVREALFPYLKKHAHAKFSFNITSGTTMRIASLFALAMWLSAEIHFTPISDEDMILPMPVLHLSSLNANQRKILKGLLPKYKFNPDMWVERHVVMEEASYIPSADVNLTYHKKECGMFADDISIMLPPIYEDNVLQKHGMNLVEELSNPDRNIYHFRLTKNGAYAAKYLHLESK